MKNLAIRSNYLFIFLINFKNKFCCRHPDAGAATDAGYQQDHDGGA